MLENFFYHTPMPPGDLHGTYNLILLTLGYVVAAFSSFLPLYIGKNIQQNGKRNYWWLLAGSFSFGLGIWTMHFISMAALTIPTNISYDPLLALLSLISVISAAAIAFYTTTAEHCRLPSIALGGIAVGIGISVTQYLGMMSMIGLHILIIPSYFLLFLLISIIASQTVMWLMVNIDKLPEKKRDYARLISGLIIGGGICGIQYTGMASAMYYSNHDKITMPSNAISNEFLSVILTVATIIIIGKAMMLAVYHTKVTNHEKSTRAILTTVADGILQIRTNGIIEKCNPAAEKILGFDPETLSGQNFYKFIEVKSDNGEPLDPEKFFNSGNKNQELMGHKKNGDQFPAEISISKLIVTQGEFFVLTIQDISQRKRKEKELLILNERLIELAKTAGMIQVTNSILHNIGNVLNSVNTSASLIYNKINRSTVSTLTEIAKLIEEHRDHMSDFLTKDDKGKKCLDFIILLAKVLPEEHANVSEEVRSLTNKVEHIKHIIKMQQAMEGNSDLLEEVDVSAIINDALSINGLNKASKFSVENRCQNIPPLLLNKVKLLQIIVNIVQNAKGALTDNGKDLKKITISSFIENNKLVIEIEDNGTGIEPEHLKKIFSFGFTTRKDGHGFGLHSCLISAQEMGGSLKVQSQGKGIGAKFRLELPYQPAKSYTQLTSKFGSSAAPKPQS